VARSFTGAGDYLTGANIPFYSGQGTIFARVKPNWSSGDSLDHVFVFGTNAGFVDLFQFQKYSDNNIKAGWRVGSVETRVDVADTGIFVSGVWGNHIIDWNELTETVNYYANTILKGTVNTPAFTVPVGLTTLYSIGNYTNGSGSANADMAELGRWNRVLSAEEHAILEATGCPLSVPLGLLRYGPLIGRNSPEIDLVSGESLTVLGTNPPSPHPRVFYPATGFVYSFPPAAVAGLEIAPPLVTNAFQVFAPTVAAAGAIVAPLVTNPFQVFAPGVSSSGEQGLTVPLVSSPFTVYAPSVSVSGSTIQEDSRELEPHNLKVRIVDFVGGDDLRITRTYTELQGGITITKAYLTIKRRAKDDTDAEAVVQKTITATEQASGKIVDDDTTGGSIQLYFDLSNTDTAALTPLIAYHYDVQVITIGHAVYTCEKGVIVMHQGVTHATA